MSRPPSSSCGGFDIRLPAADAAANANAAHTQLRATVEDSNKHDTEADEATHCGGAATPVG